MESAKTMQLLSELFYSGLKSIEKYPNMAATFGMSPEMWRYIDDAGRIKKFIQALPMRASSNPDHFYGAMHAGLTNGFDPSAEAISEIFRGLGEGKYPKALFEQTYSKFKLDTSLRECFIPEGNYYSSLADAELKSAVTDQFQIAYKSLLSSPRDESFVFTKINHGYWEHFLSVYATSFAQRSAAGEYRALEREGYVLRYSASGFDGILAHVLQQTVDPKNSDMSGRKISQRLSISFCAGESPCAITLKNPLTPVSRAAMAGALTFFKSVTKLAPLILGDGSEAKSLIDNRETSQLIEKFACDADALLFVVPPHLRNITLKGINTPIYKMIIPGSWAHETWRASLPIYLALMQKILTKHKRVTVLTQSAVLAPVLGLSMQETLVPALTDSIVRFFDLGRVLDVAAPEVVSKQGWFKQYADIPTSELSPFELSEQVALPRLISGDIE